MKCENQNKRYPQPVSGQSDILPVPAGLNISINKAIHDIFLILLQVGMVVYSEVRKLKNLTIGPDFLLTLQ